MCYSFQMTPAENTNESTTTESPVTVRVSARIDVNNRSSADTVISQLSSISVEQMRASLNDQYMLDSINGPILASISTPVLIETDTDFDDTVSG